MALEGVVGFEEPCSNWASKFWKLGLPGSTRLTISLVAKDRRGVVAISSGADNGFGGGLAGMLLGLPPGCGWHSLMTFSNSTEALHCWTFACKVCISASSFCTLSVVIASDFASALACICAMSAWKRST